MMIRRIADADFPAVARLAEQVIGSSPYYSEVERRENIARYTTAALLERRDDDREVAVAVQGGAVLGFVDVEFDGGPGAPLYVRWIITDPSARRLGVARSLLSWALAYGAAYGSYKVYADTANENTEAAKLFRRAGYRPEGVQWAIHMSGGSPEDPAT